MLSLFDAKPTPDNLVKLGAALTVNEGGTIDIDEATGKLVQDFMPNLQPEAYAPSRDDDGQHGQHRFRKHFYSRIGAFDSKEEFECAGWILF